MSIVTLKKGDTFPPMRAQLLWEDETPVSLTNVSSVIFKMKEIGSNNLKVNGTCSIVDATNGIVEYSWQSGDTDTPGFYYREFEVHYNDGKVMTVPNFKLEYIWIIDDIG